MSRRLPGWCCRVASSLPGVRARRRREARGRLQRVLAWISSPAWPPRGWLSLVVLSGALCVAGCADTSTTPASLARDDWERDAEPLVRAGRRGDDGLLDTAVADPDVIYDERARLWRLYYQTGRAKSYTAAESRMVIRWAESRDVRSWDVGAVPALAVPDDAQAWDATHTETPSVVFDPQAPSDRRFKLYYSGAGRMHPSGFPGYQIGLAVSADGRAFTRLPAAESPYQRAGLVLRVNEALPDVSGLADGVVADPEVILIDGSYHLWFSSFANSADGAFLAFGISHATSTDGIHWVPSRNNPVPSLRNAGNAGGQQPTVAWNATLRRFEMWFTSDSDEEAATIPSSFNPALGFWRATSNDAVSWQVDYGAPRDVYWRADAPDEEHGLLTGAEVVIVDGVRHLFYTGWGSRNVPSGFIVPVRDSREYVPAVLNLLHATRPATR